MDPFLGTNGTGQGDPDHQFFGLSCPKNNLLVNNVLKPNLVVNTVQPGLCFCGRKQMKWVWPHRGV